MRYVPLPLTTPDLNVPPTDTATMVPAGLVSSRLSQLVGPQGTSDGDGALEEMLKKQKR